MFLFHKLTKVFGERGEGGVLNYFNKISRGTREASVGFLLLLFFIRD